MEAASEDSLTGLDGAWEGDSPLLALDGFSGPLAQLLALARSQEIDLEQISLVALLDQLAAALQAAGRTTPLGQKGDWLVMAAWLVQLRSRLLLPMEASTQQEAERTAGRFRDRLLALQEAQALAAWLNGRPQLGQDVFARGQPEGTGAELGTRHDVDVIEFLWASMALFDDDAARDTPSVYRPRRLDLHSATEARARILRILAQMSDGAPLERLLPEPQAVADNEPGRALWRRSAWSSTFLASLELARQGAIALAQDGTFAPIHVRQGSTWAPAGEGPNTFSGELLPG